MEKMNSAPIPGLMRETAKTPLVANFRVQGSRMENIIYVNNKWF